ncbi:Leucine-rich repeat domain superfamily [Sesbania bispinosa]|nr:Leucine-rich repeat domain superfamily [Sesbania bispinosa]
MADRISTLPDEVLCHILSFLPTEEAIATSLLSRRWRSLWYSVPTLNFDDKSCRTLVVLKLKGLHVGDVSSFDLPLLKTLDLNSVCFLEPQHFMELLWGCPILEDLKVEDIYFKGSRCKGQFKTLTKLVRAHISEIQDFIIPLEAICNAEFLHIGQYSDEFPLFPNDIPLFPNLTQLEVIYQSDVACLIEWRLLIAMLKQCPKLQILVLDLRADTGYWTDWPHPNFVPECLSSKLRECTIINYEGVKSELLFAKYVMQNSRVLRTMKIYHNSGWYKFEMLKELSLCPRGSPTCELSFERSSDCVSSEDD